MSDRMSDRIRTEYSGPKNEIFQIILVLNSTLPQKVLGAF
jgi:hypothetical protein